MFVKMTTNAFLEVTCVTLLKVFAITMLALTLVPVLLATKLWMAKPKVTFVLIPMNASDQTCAMLMPRAVTPWVLTLVLVTLVTKTLMHLLSRAPVTKVLVVVRPPHLISLVPTVSTLMNVPLEHMTAMSMLLVLITPVVTHVLVPTHGESPPMKVEPVRTSMNAALPMKMSAMCSPVVPIPMVHTLVHVTMVMKLLTVLSKALIVPILTNVPLKPIIVPISLTAKTVILVLYVHVLMVTE